MLACLPRPVIPRTLANLPSRLPPPPVRHMVPPVSRGHGWDYRCKRLLLLVFAISSNRLSVSSPFRRDTLSFGPLNAIICARTTGPKPGARVPERCWSGRTGATGNRVGGESSLVGSNPILSAITPSILGSYCPRTSLFRSCAMLTWYLNAPSGSSSSHLKCGNICGNI